MPTASTPIGEVTHDSDRLKLVRGFLEWILQEGTEVEGAKIRYCLDVLHVSARDLAQALLLPPYELRRSVLAPHTARCVALLLRFEWQQRGYIKTLSAGKFPASEPKEI